MCFRDFRDLAHDDLCHRRNHHLGDAHAALYGEIVLTEIGQNDLHLAPVIAVDRAGRIQAGDAVLDGKTGTGADLGFEAFGDFEDKAGGYEGSLARLQGKRFVGRNCSAKIHSGGTARLIGRQIYAGTIFEADELERGAK